MNKWEIVMHKMIDIGSSSCILRSLPDVYKKRIKYVLIVNDVIVDVLHMSSFKALQRWSVIESIGNGEYKLRQDCYEANRRK